MSAALRVALVALSLALDVLAVSIGVGVGGKLSTRARVRVGLSFAGAEVVMNLAGVGIGAATGRAIGEVAAYVGFGALIMVGGYMVVDALRGREQPLDLSSGFGLFIASLSISLDSLGVGFSILYIGVPVVVTLAAIAVASVAATTAGLAFGRLFGKRVEDSAGVVAGFALIGTGLLFVTLKVKGVQ